MDIESRPSADKHRRTPLEIVREHPVMPPGLAIAPPGLSRDLRTLRVPGLRQVCQREVCQPAQPRTCSLRRPERLADVDAGVSGARESWQSRFDTLHIEIANGRKTR